MSNITNEQPEKPTEGFILKKEVAARLGKTERTVEIWMRQGIIPYIKIGTTRGKGRKTARRAPVIFDWPAVKAHIVSKFGVGGSC